MKLKKWLITSYIIVMLIPILTAVLLYIGIEKYNNKIQIRDYIENMIKFDKYEKVLQNPDLYIHGPKKYDLVQQNEKSKVEIELYNKDGLRIYSSIKVEGVFDKSREETYSELYKIKHGYRADSLKKPVFKNDEIVGFYEITIARTKWIEGVNNRTITAFILFGIVFSVVLFWAIRFINIKINKPLDVLIGAMGKFASGEDVHIKYDVKDEMGELISHFNSMKNEIQDKRKEIIKQQKSKEYMIAAISHDLKTPLTSITAYTELIKSQTELSCNEKEKCTTVILNKCKYMTNMIDDLLMYTVLVAGYNMNFVKVEGQEFFEMLFSGYEEVCEKNKIKFNFDIHVNGMYEVDVKQMIRIVDNLISNALRYTKREKNIYVGAYSNDYELPDWINADFKRELAEFRENGVIFFVENEGNKISKENINKIFEPFYKVDNSRNNTYKNGTGLGLSIVKLLIDRHGGKIKALSCDTSTIIVCFIKKLKG